MSLPARGRSAMCSLCKRLWRDFSAFRRASRLFHGSSREAICDVVRDCCELRSRLDGKVMAALQH